MATKISISDFDFVLAGYGCYRVTYHAKRKMYCNLITDMTLIDATKNADEPRRKDLEALKRAVKR